MVATTFGHFGVGEEGRKGGDIAEEKSGVNDQGEKEKKKANNNNNRHEPRRR